jgi:hypothetical protein
MRTNGFVSDDWHRALRVAATLDEALDLCAVVDAGMPGR